MPASTLFLNPLPHTPTAVVWDTPPCLLHHDELKPLRYWAKIDPALFLSLWHLGHGRIAISTDYEMEFIIRHLTFLSETPLKSINVRVYMLHRSQSRWHWWSSETPVWSAWWLYHSLDGYLSLSFDLRGGWVCTSLAHGLLSTKPSINGPKSS